MRETSWLLQYRLILNVAEYFERAYQGWMRERKAGNPLAHSPKWISIYETFPEHIKHWRNEAARLRLALYGERPDF